MRALYSDTISSHKILENLKKQIGRSRRRWEDNINIFITVFWDVTACSPIEVH
jgi:hypothetical protein